MAKQLIGNGSNSYVFDASAGTITFSGITLQPHQLLLINNVTRNTIIYNPFAVGQGYSSYSNGVLTLEFDTSTHADTDVLQIFYDNSDEAFAAITRLSEELSHALRLMALPSYADTSGGLRVSAVNSISTLSTVTTVATVTTVNSVNNIVGLSGIPPALVLNDPLLQLAWSNVRNLII